jgi:hypothetical protein
MMLIKIVRLGKGVIPLAKQEMAMADAEYLKRFTGGGMALIILQIIMAFVSSVVLIIISPIIPEHDTITGTIGFASKAAFQLLCTVGIVLVSYLLHWRDSCRLTS